MPGYVATTRPRARAPSGAPPPLPTVLPNAHRVPPVPLRPIHRRVRPRHQRTGIVLPRQRRAQPEARCHEHRTLRPFQRAPRQLPTQLLRHVHRTLARCVRQQRHELVASVAAAHIPAAQAVPERRSHCRHHRISEPMPVPIVQPLEVVDVQEDQRRPAPALPRLAQLRADPLHAVPPRHAPSEGVRRPSRRQLPRQLPILHEQPNQHRRQVQRTPLAAGERPLTTTHSPPHDQRSHRRAPGPQWKRFACTPRPPLPERSHPPSDPHFQPRLLPADQRPQLLPRRAQSRPRLTPAPKGLPETDQPLDLVQPPLVLRDAAPPHCVPQRYPYKQTPGALPAPGVSE